MAFKALDAEENNRRRKASNNCDITEAHVSCSVAPLVLVNTEAADIAEGELPFSDDVQELVVGYPQLTSRVVLGDGKVDGSAERQVFGKAGN